MYAKRVRWLQKLSNILSNVETSSAFHILIPYCLFWPLMFCTIQNLLLLQPVELFLLVESIHCCYWFCHGILSTIRKTHLWTLLCVILQHKIYISCNADYFVFVPFIAALAAAAAQSRWWPPLVPWIGTVSPAASGTTPVSSASFQDRPSTTTNTGTCPRRASVTSLPHLMRPAWPPQMCNFTTDAAWENREGRQLRLREVCRLYYHPNI